jgi:hypothetical protein
MNMNIRLVNLLSIYIEFCNNVPNLLLSGCIVCHVSCFNTSSIKLNAGFYALLSSDDMKLSTSDQKGVESTASAHCHSRRHHYREKISSK